MTSQEAGSIAARSEVIQSNTKPPSVPRKANMNKMD